MSVSVYSGALESPYLLLPHPTVALYSHATAILNTNIHPSISLTIYQVDPKVEDLLPGKSGIKAMIKEGRGVQLVLKKMKGKDLAEMDAELFGGLSDPYIGKFRLSAACLRACVLILLFQCFGQ
tara:strand:+ start:139 stop:510 length:372 start_codon:yes stop_codon:yes gene_type:complete